MRHPGFPLVRSRRGAAVGARRTRRSPTACRDPTTARARAGSSAITEARQGPEQTDRQRPDLQGRRRRRARPVEHLRRRPGDRRRRQRDQGRSDQARAAPRRRTRPSGCSQQLRVEVTSFGGPRRSPHHLSAARQRRAQHLGARRLHRSPFPPAAAVASRRSPATSASPSVNGEVRAETVSGDVNVSGTPNVALAKTISGDVTARDIGAPTTCRSARSAAR